MYLTTSFITSCKERNTEEVINLFKRYNLEAHKIGIVIKKKKLYIYNNKEETILFDL